MDILRRNSQFTSLSDPPEIEIEQNWYRRNSRDNNNDDDDDMNGGGNAMRVIGGNGFAISNHNADGKRDIEVELICVVHAVPEAEVNIAKCSQTY